MLPHKNKYKALVYGFGLSSAVTAVLGILLLSANIPVTTVLPTSAPIWIGLATIASMFYLD